MFKKNIKHLQGKLFGAKNLLSPKKQKKLEESKENLFYNIVFKNIEEDKIEVLYCDYNGRPNAPVNSLVGSIILMHHNEWTCEKLIKL